MKTKGLVAIHGAADTKGTWPAFSAYLGGELSTHGAGVATMNVEKPNCHHPLLAGLPAQSSLNEEWYAYKTNPRITPGVQVLLTLDEASCANCTKMPGGDHPIGWTKVDPAGGRTFYMAMGHFDHVWQKDAFSRNMLKNAILWAGGEGAATVEPNANGCATGVAQRALGATEVDIRAGAGSVLVEIAAEGDHEILVHGVAGGRVERRVAKGASRLSIEGLRGGSLYAVSVATPKGRHARLVAVP
jgi:hypothetical protein